MGGRSWSTADDNYLREHAETMTNREMADDLGRTEPSVQLRVNRMGLKGDNGRKPRRNDTYRRVSDFQPGDRVGKLRIDVSYYKQTDEGMRGYCRCTCECGEKVDRIASDLRNRDNHSCGCGKGDHVRTHGLTGTDLYRNWTCMRARCHNPNHESYNHYGGRGISICPEWDDFEEFRRWALANGWEEGLTVDRKDNDLGYSPENCRWADTITQGNNRRNNRHLTIGGVVRTVADWARRPGAARVLTIRSRLNAGWPDQEAVFGRGSLPPT